MVDACAGLKEGFQPFAILYISWRSHTHERAHIFVATPPLDVVLKSIQVQKSFN